MGDAVSPKRAQPSSLLKNVGGLWKRNDDHGNAGRAGPNAQPERHSTNRLHKRAIPSLSRPQTFRRQESERREKLLEDTPTHIGRRPFSWRPFGTEMVDSILPDADETPKHLRDELDTCHGSTWPRPRGESSVIAAEYATSSDTLHDDWYSCTSDVSWQEEYDQRWILNLSMHFRDESKREKFFVTYSETPAEWRRLTISLDYENPPVGSLEEDLSTLEFQRDKSFRVYEAIREALPEIQYYDTVTNLRLDTAHDGRLHVHVREDANEITQFPYRYPMSNSDSLRDMLCLTRIESSSSWFYPPENSMLFYHDDVFDRDTWTPPFLTIPVPLSAFESFLGPMKMSCDPRPRGIGMGSEKRQRSSKGNLGRRTVRASTTGRSNTTPIAFLPLATSCTVCRTLSFHNHKSRLSHLLKFQHNCLTKASAYEILLELDSEVDAYTERTSCWLSEHQQYAMPREDINISGSFKRSKACPWLKLPTYLLHRVQRGSWPLGAAVKTNALSLKRNAPTGQSLGLLGDAIGGPYSRKGESSRFTAAHRVSVVHDLLRKVYDDAAAEAICSDVNLNERPISNITALNDLPLKVAKMLHVTDSSHRLARGRSRKETGRRWQRLELQMARLQAKDMVEPDSPRKTYARVVQEATVTEAVRQTPPPDVVRVRSHPNQSGKIQQSYVKNVAVPKERLNLLATHPPPAPTPPGQNANEAARERKRIKQWSKRQRVRREKRESLEDSRQAWPTHDEVQVGLNRVDVPTMAGYSFAETRALPETLFRNDVGSELMKFRVRISIPGRS